MKKDIVAYLLELLKEVNRIYAESEHKPKARNYSMYDYKAAILDEVFNAEFNAHNGKLPQAKLFAYLELARFYRARGSWS